MAFHWMIYRNLISGEVYVFPFYSQEFAWVGSGLFKASKEGSHFHAATHG